MTEAEQVENWSEGQLPGIEFIDFRLRVGSHEVIRSATLAFEPGAVTGLLGPTGSGKTSLLRAIVGLEHFTGVVTRRSGDVRIGGLDIVRTRSDLRRLRSRVVMIPSAGAPFSFSVFDNVAAALREQCKNRAELRQRVSETLERCGLGDVPAGKPALALGHGQRRFLCVARALALRPAALLLDEPFDGLDPFESSRMEQLIASLAGRHTVVLATQHTERAAAVCSRMHLLIGGELVESGTTSQMLASPKDRRTEAYLSGRPAVASVES
ncbi:phosphate import ATP-binding protein PstB [Haloferula helveola]|uniref:Phosphate import ATP-binding protein PstB n=1 Tax=Haloferula helveola TaxID=490095 RepID=A0ABM7RJG9_9BACT|nr:phosphate import ATP-binding protein PstB [Haloferula helveola]